MINKCFIIAEAGSNFDGRLDQAYELIDVAAEEGADAVKFQMFKAEVLYPDRLLPVHEIVRRNELPRTWVADLINRCASVGIEFMCSPFDLEALNILVSQGVQKIKIGSSETVNLKLLRARNFYNIILTPLNIIIIFINLFLFGIAASTLFGKCLTVKNVRCTWYRLSNITVHSFHTLSPIFF